MPFPGAFPDTFLSDYLGPVELDSYLDSYLGDYLSGYAGAEFAPPSDDGPVDYEWRFDWLASYSVSDDGIMIERGTETKTWGNAYDPTEHGFQWAIYTRSEDHTAPDFGLYTVDFVSPWGSWSDTDDTFLLERHFRAVFTNYEFTHDCINWHLTADEFNLYEVDAAGDILDTLLTAGPIDESGIGYDPRLDITAGTKTGSPFGIVVGNRPPPLCEEFYEDQVALAEDNRSNGSLGIGYRYSVSPFVDEIALILLEDPEFEDCADCLPNIGLITNVPVPDDSWSTVLTSEYQQTDIIEDLGEFTCECVPDEGDGGPFSGGPPTTVIRVWTIERTFKFSESGVGIHPKSGPIRTHSETFHGICNDIEEDSSDSIIDAYTVCEVYEWTERGEWFVPCRSIVTVGACPIGYHCVWTGIPEGTECFQSLQWFVLWPDFPPCDEVIELSSDVDLQSGIHLITVIHTDRVVQILKFGNDRFQRLISPGISGDYATIRFDLTHPKQHVLLMVGDGADLKYYLSTDRGETYSLMGTEYTGTDPKPYVLCTRDGHRLLYFEDDGDLKGIIKDRNDDTIISVFTIDTGVDSVKPTADDDVIHKGEKQIQLTYAKGGAVIMLFSPDGENFSP